jgi:ATP-dependent Clp protease ATP-binding subunit ClpA
MPGPRATPEYAKEAAVGYAEAIEHLTTPSKRCLDQAERESRRRNDNHVGTEHIVLGVFAADPAIVSILAHNGVTEDLFRAQLCDEPGPSPEGRIPLTPRAQMVLGFARSAASGDGGAITPRHIMLGVIAESRDWHERGFDGPHHLEQAATAAATSLVTIDSALSGT